ncbi:GLABROUS1 enhancer-binding protein-like [Cardamine amara subsp. amara]|uniref:GLABROUS1 enhancer-binding protein-like n=1 Tax=Cardamine amara subsp. amara TaxID=228776 RepID=A0ABD1A2Z8_CARAN
MAPKKPEVIDNPPVGSSSEEEEGSSGSSGEESESSAEDSKKEESSKKLESDSEGESESESDSDNEPLNLKKQPVVIKSVSAVSVPESSNAKRPLKEADDGEAKKKLKTSTTEVRKISGDEAKKMFQRLFSEADEIALLQGVLDFTSTKGDPSEESDAFCIYVKKLIDFNATKVQIQTKLQRLKKKFTNTVKKSLKKGKNEDEIKFAKDLDQKSFDLSRKIWGNNGVLASKSRKKLGGTSKEMKLVPHSTPKKQEETKMPERTEIKVVNTRPSIAREIASFFNLENASVCGLDESTIVAAWEKVGDGAKKKEMEEKWNKLKAMQVELCIQRTALVAETAKMIFKANK